MKNPFKYIQSVFGIESEADRRFHALLEGRSYGPEDDYWYYPVSQKSLTGLDVNEYNVLQYSDVYKCVRVISETIASLPCFIYKRLKGGGKERAEDHPLYDIFHIQPNPEMTAFQFRETMMNHLLTWGNFYGEIDRNGMGEITALWPLRPDRMRVVRGEDSLIAYQYRPTDGTDQIIFSSDDILHIPGLGFNGIIGYSPVAMAREAISLGKSAEEFASRFFSNDATPPMVLQHPMRLTDNARDNFKKAWKEAHGGLSNKWKPAILEEGMTIHSIGVPMKDAQFLDLRKFQRTEICGIYRVPPHMIMDLERATFSNIEQQSLDFVVNCIRPWLVRIEQGMLVKLFSEKERKKYFPEHLVDALLRGDIMSRYAAYKMGREGGWLNLDEIREKENMNPIPNGLGKDYIMPLNYIKLGEEPPPPPEKPVFTEKSTENGENLEKKSINSFYINSLDADSFAQFMQKSTNLDTIREK